MDHPAASLSRTSTARSRSTGSRASGERAAAYVEAGQRGDRAGGGRAATYVELGPEGAYDGCLAGRTTGHGRRRDDLQRREAISILAGTGGGRRRRISILPDDGTTMGFLDVSMVMVLPATNSWTTGARRRRGTGGRWPS